MMGKSNAHSRLGSALRADVSRGKRRTDRKVTRKNYYIGYIQKPCML